MAATWITPWGKGTNFSDELGDIYRKDVWSIPISPLREIVTNALVHASYSTQGTALFRHPDLRMTAALNRHSHSFDTPRDSLTKTKLITHTNY